MQRPSKTTKGHLIELPIWASFRMSRPAARVRVYCYRYGKALSDSTCRGNVSDKLKCRVSWHCVFEVPGLRVSPVSQGRRGEWVFLLSHFSVCFKTLVKKSSCFVCSADKDTTMHTITFSYLHVECVLSSLRTEELSPIRAVSCLM